MVSTLRQNVDGHKDQETGQVFHSNVDQSITTYLNFLNKAGSSAANTGGTLRYNYKKCSPESMAQLRSEHNLAIPNSIVTTNEERNRIKTDNQKVVQCAFDVQTSLEALYTGTKCNNFEKKPNNPTYNPKN